MERLKGGSDEELMSLFDGHASKESGKFCVSRIGIVSQPSSSVDGEEAPPLSSARELRKRVAQVNAKRFLAEADQRMSSEEQLEDAAAAAASTLANVKHRGRRSEWGDAEEQRRGRRTDEEPFPDDKEAFVALDADTVRGCGVAWIPRDAKRAMEMAAENELQANAVEHRECSHGWVRDPSDVYGNGLMDMRREEIKRIKDRSREGEAKRERSYEAGEYDRLALATAVTDSRDRLRRFENLSKREGTEMFLLMGDKVIAGITAVGARPMTTTDEEEGEFYSCGEEEYDDDDDEYSLEEQQREL